MANDMLVSITLTERFINAPPRTFYGIVDKTYQQNGKPYISVALRPRCAAALSMGNLTVPASRVTVVVPNINPKTNQRPPVYVPLEIFKKRKRHEKAAN